MEEKGAVLSPAKVKMYKQPQLTDYLQLGLQHLTRLGKGHTLTNIRLNERHIFATRNDRWKNQELSENP